MFFIGNSFVDPRVRVRSVLPRYLVHPYTYVRTYVHTYVKQVRVRLVEWSLPNYYTDIGVSERASCAHSQCLIHQTRPAEAEIVVKKQNWLAGWLRRKKREKDLGAKCMAPIQRRKENYNSQRMI